MNEFNNRPAEVLLVEDSPADIRLATEAFKRASIANHLSVVEDGLDAMAFLRRQGNYATAPRPDLILLDLKLPVMDGHEVLAAIKADENLKSIPVVVLTCSPSDLDVLRSYRLQACCHIIKPVDFEEFKKFVATIESFFFSMAVLPSRAAHNVSMP